jgi:hypothetical protein
LPQGKKITEDTINAMEMSGATAETITFFHEGHYGFLSFYVGPQLGLVA